MALSKVDPDAVDRKQMQIVSYDSATHSINFSRTKNSAQLGTVTSLVRDESNNDVYAGGSMHVQTDFQWYLIIYRFDSDF